MNSLAHTDLQTYLHRLIKEHLPPKEISEKRVSHDSATPHQHTTGNKRSAKGKGDH